MGAGSPGRIEDMIELEGPRHGAEMTLDKLKNHFLVLGSESR